MPQKTVGDLMHKGVIACGPETMMSEVVRIVNDTSVHAILVMDDQGSPIGMVSHMDIIRLYGKDLSEYRARDAMSGPVIAIESDGPARRGVDLMVTHGVERLLVVETEAGQSTPVGMLSTTDLVKDMRGARWIWHVG
ncbi:MAG TPA: CBS domain-containing protein [Anaerolineae bacterium]|nr:CBS domain-containing protein [Anaerolineae bacterium]